MNVIDPELQELFIAGRASAAQDADLLVGALERVMEAGWSAEFVSSAVAGDRSVMIRLQRAERAAHATGVNLRDALAELAALLPSLLR